MVYQKAIGPAVGSIFIEPYKENRWKITFRSGDGDLVGVRLKKGHFWAKSRVLSKLAKLTEEKLDFEFEEKTAKEIWEEISIDLEKQWKALERERKSEHKEGKEDPEEEQEEELSEEEKERIQEKAEELLEKENILQHVKAVLDEKIVGEDKNKLFLFLTMLSHKTDHPQACYVIGSSSAGKSYLVNNVKKLFGDRVLWYSRVTSKVLDRMGKDLADKIFIVGEQSGAVEAESLLRQWLSEGKLRLLTNVKENGEIKQKEIETEGKPVFVTTTTSRAIEQQMGTRIWVMELDESEEQTEEILEHQAREEMGLNRENKETLRVLQEAVKKLEDYDVLVPYADKLKQIFPKGNVRSRRDFKKLLHLIEVCALLHQKNRPLIADENGFAHLLATRADFEIIWKLVKDKLTPTLTGLTEQHRAILQVIGEEELDQNAISDRLDRDIPMKTLYDRLRELRNWGYLRIREGSRGQGKANIYFRVREAGDLMTLSDIKSMFPIEESKLSKSLPKKVSLDEELCMRVNKKGYDPTKDIHSHICKTSSSHQVQKEEIEESKNREKEGDFLTSSNRKSEQPELKKKDKEENEPERPSEVKEKVKDYLQEEGMVPISELNEALDYPPSKLNNVLHRMIQEGEICEPRQGKLKLLK